MKKLKVELTYMLDGQELNFVIDKYPVPKHFIINDANKKILAKELEAFYELKQVEIKNITEVE